MKIALTRISIAAAALALAIAGSTSTALASTGTAGSGSNNCSTGNTGGTFNFGFFRFFQGSPVGQNCSGNGANGTSSH